MGKEIKDYITKGTSTPGKAKHTGASDVILCIRAMLAKTDEKGKVVDVPNSKSGEISYNEGYVKVAVYPGSERTTRGTRRANESEMIH